MKVVEVTCGSEHLFEKALIAVGDFVRSVPGGNVPFSWYVERMTACFRVGSPLMLLLLILNDTEEVIGHLLAFVENHYGTMVGYCYQARLFAVGEARDRRGIGEEVMARYTAWARENKCLYLVMGTPRSERAMARRFGFTKRTTIMVKSVEG